MVRYKMAGQSVGWDLSQGFLFSEIKSDGPLAKARRPAALKPSDMTAQLKAHLRAAGMQDKHTMHSFRTGGALAQALADESLQAIMQRVQWKTSRVALHYVDGGAAGIAAPVTRQGASPEERYRWADAFPKTTECAALAFFPTAK